MKQYKNMALKNGGRICAVIIMILCLGIFGCAEEDDVDESGKHSIVGAWKADKVCAETYEYTSENNFVLKSNQITQSGTYSFVADATADGRYKLTFNISTHQGVDDCGFASTAGQGATSEFYVLFSNNNQTHILYSVTDGARILSASRIDLPGCDCGI